VAQPESSELAESYDVVLLGFEPRAEPAALGLQRVFGVDRDAAEGLLQGLPRTVRRGVNRVRAEYFRRALVSIGAHVEVRNAHGDAVSTASAQPIASADTERPRRSHPPLERAPVERTLLLGAAPPMASPAPGVRSVAPRAAELPGLLLLADESAGGNSATEPALWERLELADVEPGVADSLESIRAQPAARSSRPASVKASVDADLPLLERWQMPDPAEFAPPNRARPSSERVFVKAPPQAIQSRRSSAPSIARAPAAERVQQPTIEPRTFWECVPEAVQFPWFGRGRVWLGSIGAWALVTNLVAGWIGIAPLSALVALVANSCVLALCADLHRRCVWAAVRDAVELEESPELGSARSYDLYLRSGVHITVFGLLSQLPLVVWLTRRALEAGASGAREVLGSPAFWLLALASGAYWPMAVATASHAKRFAGIWQIGVGLRAIARAPLEYSVIVGLGGLCFALPWLACVIVAKIAGLPVLFFAALAGLPLALSHAVMGTLTGQLLRTRPEVFE
jgi:hypothetical protein